MEHRDIQPYMLQPESEEEPGIEEVPSLHTLTFHQKLHQTALLTQVKTRIVCHILSLFRFTFLFLDLLFKKCVFLVYFRPSLKQIPTMLIKPFTTREICVHCGLLEL